MATISYSDKVKINESDRRKIRKIITFSLQNVYIEKSIQDFQIEKTGPPREPKEVIGYVIRLLLLSYFLNADLLCWNPRLAVLTTLLAENDISLVKKISESNIEIYETPPTHFPLVKSGSPKKIPFSYKIIQLTEKYAKSPVEAIHRLSENKTSDTFLETEQVSTETNKRDIFLCHASEDKEVVLEPLVKDLLTKGYSLWYDAAEIKWGDSITKKVNEGLSISKYVVVILSISFLKKNWPQRELFAALNIEAKTGESKVLPLLVGTENQIEEIINNFPILNDKLYIIWNNNPKEVTLALEKILEH